MKYILSFSSFFSLHLLLFVVFNGLSMQTLQAQLNLLDKKESTTCVDREFTVMAHLVRDTFQVINSTPENIAAALELVNLWYEPICVRFRLAQVDTIDNFQYDEPVNTNELEQLWTHYNEPNRINIYVITNTGNVSAEPVFATDEGILLNDQGGILINFPQLNNDPLWLVHAFGHYCGLLDTQEEMGVELVDGSNCETNGDEICDTPADPLDPNAPFGGLGLYFDTQCRFIFNGLDANGEFYVPQTGNALSRYPTGCWCGLTFEQFQSMAEVIGRSGLW